MFSQNITKMILMHAKTSVSEAANFSLSSFVCSVPLQGGLWSVRGFQDTPDKVPLRWALQP